MASSKRSLWNALVIVLSIVGGNMVGAWVNGGQGNLVNRMFSNNYFFPAGYVFGTVWSLIYLGMISFGIWAAMPARREDGRLQRTGSIIALSMFLNIAWLLSFQLEFFGISLLVMLVLVATAFQILAAMGVGQRSFKGFESWLTWPMRVYLGWLSLASLLNIIILFLVWGWRGESVSYLMGSLLLAGIALGVGLGLWFWRRDRVIAGVYVYAAIGIYVRQKEAVPTMAYVALGLAALFLALIVWETWRGMNVEPKATTAP